MLNIQNQSAVIISVLNSDQFPASPPANRSSVKPTQPTISEPRCARDTWYKIQVTSILPGKKIQETQMNMEQHMRATHSSERNNRY